MGAGDGQGWHQLSSPLAYLLLAPAPRANQLYECTSNVLPLGPELGRDPVFEVSHFAAPVLTLEQRGLETVQSVLLPAASSSSSLSFLFQ